MQSVPHGFDDPFSGGHARRRLAQVVAVVVVLGLVAWLAPGLGQVRDTLGDARPSWLVLAVVLEAASSACYVLMFRPVFCRKMTWRSAAELGGAELAVGSLVPASGVGGLALGAWALRKTGMPAEAIARRTVAFYVIKSAANFVAVAVIGVAMWLGAGPHRSPLLTILPAGLAVVSLAAVAAIPRVGRHEHRGGGRVARLVGKVVDALSAGVAQAGEILRRGDWRVIAGSLGYWAFDNAVLWAAFRAFGHAPALTVVLMGYLIGQLGGLLPIPGGLGGIDGGLIGTLVVFGVAAGVATAAVFAYRLILFGLPLVLGGVAFASLRRGMLDPERPDLFDRQAAAAA